MKFKQPWVLLLLMIPSAITQADATERGVSAMQVPPGYVVEAIAAPPVTLRPMMGGFDDQGRLYLAESAGINLEAKDLLEKKPNFIRQLVDRDGDGVFESSTVFADQMTFPMGALWYRGSLYVASPPYIWKLTDTNDDGVADERTVIVGAFGFIGNAADIHGCFLSPGGRIYWCDGRHGHEFLDKDGKVLSKGKAARIFSCWPDGSDVRWHAGGGMDNPVEVDFLPEGQTLGVVNLFYNKRGDCLVHWLHGGVYPREDQPLTIAEFRRTGDLLGPVHDFGHVAVAGCLRSRHDEAGFEINPSPESTSLTSTWYVCHFNTHELAKVKLVPSGPTYAAQSEIFLSSRDPDFHPTDVIEDADGSLIVVDTGGWFRNGCPTSQIAKPDITGGLYRIRKKDDSPNVDPRGLKLDWSSLTDLQRVERLGDARPAVRERALDSLAAHLAGPTSKSTWEGLRASFASFKPGVRRNLVWAMARAGGRLPAEAFRDADEQVRQAALLASQDRPRAEDVASLIERLRTDSSPAVRREAAVALGRAQDPAAVASLLAAAAGAPTGAAPDRSLEHALIYALIELNAWEATAAGLSSDHSTVRKVALVALDQMDGRRLTRDQVAPLLDTSDAGLLKATLEVIAKRSGWSEEIISLVRGWLKESSLDPRREAMVRGALTSMIREPAVQTLMGESLSQADLAPAAHVVLLDIVTQLEAGPVPAEWMAGIRTHLSSTNATLRLAAVRAAGRAGESFWPDLEQRVADSKEEEGIRLASVRLLAIAHQRLEPGTWEMLLHALTKGRDVDRLAVADAIAQADLSDAQRKELIPFLSTAGPVELVALTRAFPTAQLSESLGIELARVLSGSAVRTSLPISMLEQWSRSSTAVEQALAPIIHEIQSQKLQQRERVARWSSLTPQGDPARGKALFFSPRASCSSCHAVQGEGGAIGPDLSKIGASRTEQDLAESIVLPSASLARGYESVRILTSAGQVLVGVTSRESTNSIWLRLSDRSEVRIAREDIEEISPSPQSIMPEGLDQPWTDSEGADLIAYLKSLR